ncbi:Pyoverdine export ATP-binding/permease protein PvdT OS=Bosea thiooxidans OX=53254 GN=SAMN05660750_02426 PE=3 SV=1 [Bosea thiooxidans]|uniref:Pyoverdine export ATP-binding/permease protein PvdT n=1 Tax=Bosea thiooxidans TaxID=53254 RepID=A0A1T5E7V7_9HYPH|nr:MacB family efflux pump subunit [Bosea thiooxidans]SKB79940.1 macrolide transport system ATP-binding/permease protein [Bosea thiooxidans]
MGVPLIRLAGVRRDFGTGEATVAALDGADLVIEAGEMVAIVGQSGSGKSTLMNIIGCLDRPTGGSYEIDGRPTRELDPDELARLRREYFGFVFQRYHLLSELTALANVEVPAIYAGIPPGPRQSRAAMLLDRLGLGSRMTHRPSELSGGQQQRVSVARALMNGARVLLADEPTGALDRKSGEEMLALIEELNREGHTVILVTHDMNVANRAHRIIELSDGRIVADRRTAPGSEKMPPPSPVPPPAGRLRAGLGRLREAFGMAVRAMTAHKLRTTLTMLGIVIGIAAVVSVVALGEGARQRVLQNISGLGTNTLEIFPGAGFGDLRSGRVKTLTVLDAQVLAGQPYAASVTPTVTTSATVRFGNVEATAQVNGVSERYFDVRGSVLTHGSFFDTADVRTLAQDVVIDENARSVLFPQGPADPVGTVILIGSVPSRIVGVIRQQQGGFGGSQNPQVFLPYTTVQGRFLGDLSLRSITLRVDDETPMAAAQEAVTELLTHRHRAKDFFILNQDEIRNTITSTTQTMTLMISSIAVISLLVGGIGVMNIMLVSVIERTSEIGLRMAVGARRSDILQQFLIEASLVCFIGGALGIALALAVGFLFEASGSQLSFIYSGEAFAAAIACSTLIGLTFGFLPARNAARLDPVAALARD